MQIIEKDLEFAIPGSGESQVHLLLKADYTAIVLDNERGSPTGEVGNWTQVYDQSIIVELPNVHKAKYMANMRYTIKKGYGIG